MNISTARARLFGKIGYRLAAAMVTRLEVVEEPDAEKCPTMATDGKRLLVNPAFVDSLEPAQLYWVLVHEGYHCKHWHHLRFRRLIAQHFPNADAALKKQLTRCFNIAADYAINLLIPRRPDVQMVEGALYDTAYTGMSAEELFWKFWEEGCPEESDPEIGEDGEEKDDGRPKLEPYPCEPDEVDAEEKKEVRAVSRMAQKFSEGELPDGLEQEIRDVKEGKVDYREVLQPWMTEFAPIDYSYRRPSRRFEGDFIRPTLAGEAFANFVFIGDSSGSMIGRLEEVVGEIMSLLEMMSNGTPDSVGLTCLWTDTKVYRQDLKIGDTPKPMGGGGTDFRKCMDYLIEHMDEINPKAAIFMTDGDVYQWGRDPGIPVLFLAVDRHFTPPYGEVVALI